MGTKEKKSKKSSSGSKEKIEAKLKKLEDDIAASRKKMVKLLSKAGSRDVEDYELKDTSGNPVKLSEMFGDKENLILIHNMGRSCSYCTLWADGFSGVNYFIEKKAAFALTSPDAPEVQKEFAASRGWKLKTYSTDGSSFTKDMGYQDDKGYYWPGVSVFHKEKDGSIRRVAKDFFGPGDFYSSPFHLFDLLPNDNGKDEK